MKNLMDLEVFKLNKVQMNNVFGGISREEYCKQIQELATAHTENTEDTEMTWTNEQWDSWSAAYEKHCMQGE